MDNILSQNNDFAYQVAITTDQKNYAWDLIHLNNYGKRGEFDGSPEAQYTGKLAEVVFADLMGLPRPENVTEDDHGIDFVSPGFYGRPPINIDVKATGMTTPVKREYFSNIVKCQVAHSLTHVYLFICINKKTSVAEIVGWLPKSEIMEDWTTLKGEKYVRGDGVTWNWEIDLYRVPNSELYRFDPITFFDEISDVI